MSALAEALTGALRQVELELAADEARQVELTEAEAYARDPIGWINAFVWIATKFAGQRNRVKPARMGLFPDQVQTIAAWIDLPHLEATGELVFRNVVIEKSRQIGETWLFAAVIAWALHYHAVQLLAIHQKGAEIANRGPTIKSLFGRIKYIDERLDRGRLRLAHLTFKPFSGGDPASVTNDHLGSAIYGESRRDDPGRGGTYDAILVDEAAYVQHGEAVYAAIDEACPNGKALLSTPKGSDNFHARIADEEPDGWRYLRLHWSNHPIYGEGVHVAAIPPTDGKPGRYGPQRTKDEGIAARACALCAGTIRGERWSSRTPTAHRFPSISTQTGVTARLASPWYDRAVVGKTIEQVASELDIDREKSLTARVYDEFDTTIHVAHGPDGREAVIPYDPTLPLELAFDYGLDCTSVVVCQDHPLEYRIIGEVEITDRPGETPTPDNVARALLEELSALGVAGRELDPRWSRMIYAIGDVSGEGRSLDTGRPLISAYRAQGFDIGSPPRRLVRLASTSIVCVKELLLGNPKPVRWSARCQVGIRHMRHNRWPTDQAGNRRIGATVPLDDEHNHYCRALAYLIVTKFPPQTDTSGGRPDPWSDADDYASKRWGSLVDEAEPVAYDSTG